MSITWEGVMPAITTAFDSNLNIDHAGVDSHVNWLVDNGCTGIVTPGSLGESATLSVEEKHSLWKTCIDAVGDRVPVIAAIASLSTAEAVGLAQRAKEMGCSGLMVLPPYVYKSDWREMKAHVDTVFRATNLSCMLYNNPVAYGTDYLPEQIAELETSDRRDFGEYGHAKWRCRRKPLPIKSALKVEAQLYGDDWEPIKLTRRHLIKLSDDYPIMGITVEVQSSHGSCDTLHRMTDDSELAALIEIERAGLAVMFRLMAASRLVEAGKTGDQRYNAAARSIKKIAKTMDMIDDGTLTKLSCVNQSATLCCRS